MHQHIASSRPLRRLLVASVLGLALVSLVGLGVGVGISVQAQQPDEVDITGTEGQAVSSTAARYSTHPVSSYATISDTGWVSGTGTLTFTAIVPLSPTVTICGSGEVTLSARYTPSGSIPVSIEGATPTSAFLELPVTDKQLAPFPIDGWKTIVYHVNRSIDTSILVTGTGPVTITGGGPVGGEVSVLVEGDLEHCVAVPMIIKQDLGFYFWDDFNDPNSGWVGGTYDNGVLKVTADGGEQRVVWNPAVESANGTFRTRVRRTSASDPDYQMNYGFFFAAGPAAEEDRFALEVVPHEFECGGEDTGLFYLSYREGSQKNHMVNEGDDTCGEDIDTDQNDWNELEVIRNGENIVININGEKQGEWDVDVLQDDDHKYFDLIVTALGVERVRAEFDWVEIRGLP
ncbi:MAG: hypothetical protein H8E35_09295 [Ardenticatenia bacterium]|nr:hypothetical protein [Ardenticatenia bacterium]